MPVLDTGPLRAVMPIIVTVRGFDTSYLVLDLADHIKASLSWATAENVIAYDTVPIEDVDASGLGERIGAFVLSIAPSQPVPVYVSEGDLPDQAAVRILLEQLISPKEADRDDLLVKRRKEIVELIGPVNGEIP